MEQRTTSVYARIALTVIGARLALAVWPIPAFHASQEAALSWPFLTVVLLLGYGGVWLLPKVKLPALLSPAVDARQRSLVPAAMGVIIAIPFIGLDLVFRFPADLNVPLPQGLFFYFVGAFISEVIFHLVPVVLLLGLIDRLVLRGRWPTPVFWSVALLVALLEPITQVGGDALHGYATQFLVLFGVFAYLLNLVQIVVLRHRGFLAMWTVRLGFYLIWHAIWGSIRLRLLF